MANEQHRYQTGKQLNVSQMPHAFNDSINRFFAQKCLTPNWQTEIECYTASPSHFLGFVNLSLVLRVYETLNELR